jgi:hypothetical protein
MLLDFLWKSKLQRNFDRNVKREYNSFRAWLYTVPNGTIVSGDKMAVYFRHILDDPSQLPTIKANDNPTPLKNPKDIFWAAIRDYEYWLANKNTPQQQTGQMIDASRLAQQRWNEEPVCRYCGRRGWAGTHNEAGSCSSSPHGRHEMR